MGTGGNDRNDGSNISDDDLFEAYNSLKNIRDNIDPNKYYFLVFPYSISNYIKIIVENEDLKNDFLKKTPLPKEDIINHFRGYKKQKISFLHNYVQCFRLSDQDIEEQNKFIIVDETFVDIISRDNDDKNRFKIKIVVDQPYNRVQFLSEKKIAFQEVNYLLYKFNT